MSEKKEIPASIHDYGRLLVFPEAETIDLAQVAAKEVKNVSQIASLKGQLMSNPNIYVEAHSSGVPGP